MAGRLGIALEPWRRVAHVPRYRRLKRRGHDVRAPARHPSGPADTRRRGCAFFLLIASAIPNLYEKVELSGCLDSGTSSGGKEARFGISFLDTVKRRLPERQFFAKVGVIGQQLSARFVFGQCYGLLVGRRAGSLRSAAIIPSRPGSLANPNIESNKSFRKEIFTE